MAYEMDKLRQPGNNVGSGAGGSQPFAGIGVDIVEVARMERILERTPRFRERFFSAEERAYCDRRTAPARHYAARLAAKEAVAKALGSGFSGFGPADVEIVLDKRGRPSVRLCSGAARLASREGVVAVHISLSHTSGLAIANAVAVTQAALPQKNERKDSQKHLIKAFKEVRGVLDQIDGQLASQMGATAPEPPVEREV